MLGVRPADLHRLHDVRAGRDPLSRSRGHAQGGKKPLQIKPPTVRRAPGIALATGERAGHEDADRDQRRDLSHHRGAGRSDSTRPGGTLYFKWMLYGPFVAHGDWWRLVTAMFLHGSLIHIGFNMLALWCDRRAGRAVPRHARGTSASTSSRASRARPARSSPVADDAGGRRVRRDLRDPRRDAHPRVAGDRAPRRPGDDADRDQPRVQLRLNGSAEHLDRRPHRRADRRHPRHARLRALARHARRTGSSASRESSGSSPSRSRASRSRTGRSAATRSPCASA